MKKVFVLWSVLLLSCLLIQCKEAPPPALKHRKVKITAQEKSKIAKLLKEKHGLNLGILLKIIPANIDDDSVTERIVAYRSKN